MLYTLVILGLYIFTIFGQSFAPKPSLTARLEPAPRIKPAPKVLGAYMEAGPKIPSVDIHKISKADIDPLKQIDYPVKRKDASMLRLASRSGLIMDPETGKILFEKNKDEERRIASITKLMTAYVFLDMSPGWDKVVEIKDEYKREGGRIFLFRGDKVTVKDLFYSSLVGSGNSETIALISSTGLSEKEYVAKMNEKAAAMGLKHTRFEDPVGLSNANVSTAHEIGLLAKQALEKKEISDAVLTKTYKLNTKEGKMKSIASTDRLLSSFPAGNIAILGGKTGYTEMAGYCFTGKFRNKAGNEIITVILGAQALTERFTETREAVEWAFNNFNWKEN